MGSPSLSPSRPRLVRFGLFELDIRSGELRKEGLRVTLQDQPLRLLECLLERPGEIVTRDELRARLWPGDTFVDFEQGVNAAVRRLREALGDSADAPRFVQTIPRRGYRFIAPVARENPGAPPSVNEPVGVAAGLGEPNPVTAPVPTVVTAARIDAVIETSPRTRTAGRRLVAIGLTIAGLLIAVAWWAGLKHPASPWTRATDPAGSSAAGRDGRGGMRPRANGGAAGVAGAASAPRIVSLTTLSGSEHQPTFSPDGRQVAFAWDGGGTDNGDIYVTLVGSADVRRLTTDAGRDLAPQWSPDGQQIAFARAIDAVTQRIRVMSALGGSEREVSAFPVFAPIAWSPDGRFLAAGHAGDTGAIGRGHAIHLIPLAVGEPRQLTHPEAGHNDWSPAFSPDGRQLAYASCADLIHRSVCHVQIVDLDASFAPTGPPRRLTPDSVWTIDGITWTRDGRNVVYSARQGSLIHLWRADVDSRRPPERVELAGRDVVSPAIAPAGDRLAYARATEDTDIYRFDPPGSVRPVARSSVRDSMPQFSPDGNRIAYCSARSNDAFEVWIAGLDDSPPRRLTHGPGSWQCSPDWSPDGTRITFDSRDADGSWHVWTIGVDGGAPRRITSQRGSQMRPSWSRDGRWIYFVWARDTDRDIWRTRWPDGPVERVTHGGALVSAGREAADGTGIYYKQTLGDAPLLFQPLGGGAARPVVPCVKNAHYALGPAGVYYMPCARAGDATHDAPVRVRDVENGADQLFGTLTDVLWPAAGRSDGYFVVAPNGRTLLFIRLASREADLMLIEHFR